MRLNEVIRGIAIKDRRGRFDTTISRVTEDSRLVGPGSLFVAVRGSKQDGHDYIGAALKKGASSVMAEAWPDDVDEEAWPNVVLVPNSRRGLALAASNYYGQPSRRLLIAAVTGTNGKTTTTYVLESIIKAASKKVGVIGGIETRYDSVVESSQHTTPGSVKIQDSLGRMLKKGVTHVVMEVSSHALAQQRVTGVHFKVAGFTNLTEEHLDYHQSMDAYFEAKSHLFSELLRKSRARGRMAVVNIDDSRGGELLERWGGKALRVSMDPKSDADVVALEAEYALTGTKALVRTPKGEWTLSSALVGAHNLSNVLLGVGMALAMGFSKARIMRGLAALERVPGRLEPILSDEGKCVFVDYAHTADALKKTLGALKPLTQGRLIVVFGAGGDRDKKKRGPMGRAVAQTADLAFITNDNPRTEDPRSIADQIAAAMKETGSTEDSEGLAKGSFRIELDRRSAIRMAVNQMKADDVLVVAGKGHEQTQVVGKSRFRFDDREEIRRILAGQPPPPPLKLEDAVEGEEASIDLDASVSQGYESELPEVPELTARESTITIEADHIIQQIAEDGMSDSEDASTSDNGDAEESASEDTQEDKP